MTDFREALLAAADDAARAYRYDMGDVRMNLARAFLQSLEASGFKLIGPDATLGMVRDMYAATYAAAPTLADRLGEQEKPE